MDLKIKLQASDLLKKLLCLALLMLPFSSCTKVPESKNTGSTLRPVTTAQNRVLSTVELIQKRVQYDGKVITIEGTLYNPADQGRVGKMPLYYLCTATNTGASKVEQCGLWIERHQIANHKNLNGKVVVVTARFHALEPEASPSKSEDPDVVVAQFSELRGGVDWLGELLDIKDIREK